MFRKRIPALLAGATALAIASTITVSPAMAAVPSTALNSNSSTLLVGSAGETENKIQASDKAEAAALLEAVFTEAIKLDSKGLLISYDETRAIELLGADEAKKITAAVNQTTSLTTGSPRVAGRSVATAAAGQTFTDCMIQNSVLGLITGISTGTYAAMIAKQQWNPLVEKLWPKLVRAGVGGGVAGVVTGLAASAVQCTFWRD